VRTIGVVTTSRADYGLYRPILRRIQEDPELDLYLFVSGMHLSPEFGMTVQAIEEDGFEVGDRIEMLLSSETPEGISKAMGLGTIGFAQAFARRRPDILLVLGDRFEMHAAVVAALPFKLPVAHIHGGELTEGAIDDAIRHSITKLSHLHFVATETYAQRVVQMGEEPWRVVVSGAPGLDNLREIELLSREELEERYGVDLRDPFFLVTYHPVTLEYEQTERQIDALLGALEEIDAKLVFTYPNADMGSRLIVDLVQEFAACHQRAELFVSLGTQGYFSMMSHAAMMIGNSSSGIIEAASFNLPVVNVGSRQNGRVRGANVIDVGCSREGISSGVAQASIVDFRESISDLVNPYGDGGAADRILGRLKHVELDKTLLLKRFHSV
jgi:UDP-N-acetylglucosamine 2-epimerase (non-hydrolysing)/GDP/UDP-N,N'-diacetylbacillosamine 2-epimerase (hydrolysing)